MDKFLDGLAQFLVFLLAACLLVMSVAGICVALLTVWAIIT